MLSIKHVLCTVRMKQPVRVAVMRRNQKYQTRVEEDIGEEVEVEAGAGNLMSYSLILFLNKDLQKKR